MKKFDDLMSVSNEIENISASDAKEKLNDPNVQFIDVRDKESFSKGTIGNAIHLDRGLLEFYLAEGSPLENDMFKNNPDKEYVVFCGVGGQGTLATKTMKDMGVKNVKNITGGMKEWEKKFDEEQRLKEEELVRKFYSDEIPKQENNQDAGNLETKTDENNVENKSDEDNLKN